MFHSGCNGKESVGGVEAEELWPQTVVQSQKMNDAKVAGVEGGGRERNDKMEKPSNLISNMDAC